MRGKLGDKARINHIIESIQEIETYVLDSDKQAFIQNSMMRFACIKQLEIIGEACNHISKELKESHPAIKWKEIVGLRNIFVHEYFGIDNELLWDIIKNDLRGFHDEMIKILKGL